MKRTKFRFAIMQFWKPLVFCSFALSLSAQTGGLNDFSTLNMYYNAKQLGLSGNLISSRDRDVFTTFYNPAGITSEQMKLGALGQTLRAGGISTGSLAYGIQLKNISTVAHFRYVSYGSMKRTDVTGNEMGNFSTGEYILGYSASKKMNERMYAGATLNLLYSQLESYTQFGASVDIGGQYIDEDRRLILSGVVKNLGTTIKSFNGTKHALPLDVQLGISHKLAHAPFKFHFTAKQLTKWDLSYNDPNAKPTIDALTGDSIPVKKAGFVEKAFRHALIQTELMFSPKFHLRVGFDYQRRREMAVANRPGLAGFGFGAGIYLKRFHLEYGWNIYSAAGAQHGITLQIPFNQ